MTTENAELTEARRLHALDTTALARDLYAKDEAASEYDWEHAATSTRRDYLIQACNVQTEARKVIQAAQAEAAKQQAIRDMGAAVDRYRETITTRIPAHRIETRINGFKDGWDAAMHHLQTEGK